ncbi:MAG: hypothetical protein WAM14_12255 [Candidatus Nitrosopolaris sp.]
MSYRSRNTLVPWEYPRPIRSTKNVWSEIRSTLKTSYHFKGKVARVNMNTVEMITNAEYR